MVERHKKDDKTAHPVDPRQPNASQRGNAQDFFRGGRSDMVNSLGQPVLTLGWQHHIPLFHTPSQAAKPLKPARSPFSFFLDVFSSFGLRQLQGATLDGIAQMQMVGIL
jgi:hypothetical protein